MLDLEPATRVLTDLVPGVRDDQLSLPTPCAEAGLGDLLAHVDGFSIAFTAAATKTPSPGGGQRARPDASRLGTDWRTRIPGRLAALAAAWREPAAWTGRTSVGGQDFPGEVTGVIALDEVVVHGWAWRRPAGSSSAASRTCSKRRTGWSTESWRRTRRAFPTCSNPPSRFRRPRRCWTG